MSARARGTPRLLTTEPEPTRSSEVVRNPYSGAMPVPSSSPSQPDQRSSPTPAPSAVRRGARRRKWVGIEAVGVFACAGVVTLEAVDTHAAGYTSPLAWMIALLLLCAAVFVRAAPWVAFGLMWAALLAEWYLLADLMLSDIVIVYLLFGLALWGSKRLVWATAVSLPFAVGIMLHILLRFQGNFMQTRVIRNFILGVIDTETSWETLGAITILAILLVPWLAGLALRFLRMSLWASSSREVAEAENRLATFEQAQMKELAEMRRRQSELARDVHDVVGHSLAVILSQAESGQFIDRSDEAARAAVLTNIADTSRRSLRDVREVLSAMRQDVSHLETDHLIAACRKAGVQVELEEVGSPRRIVDGAREAVYRTLQELLTNAIKYGVPGRSIQVERNWSQGLRLRVRNPVSVDRARVPGSRQGLIGVRERAEAAGAQVTIEPGRQEFTATVDFPARILAVS